MKQLLIQTVKNAFNKYDNNTKYIAVIKSTNNYLYMIQLLIQFVKNKL